MRKLLILLFALTCLLTACSTKECQNNKYVLDEFEYASIEIVDNNITDTGLTLKLTYNGENSGTYGSWYELQVKERDCWVDVEVVVDGEYAFTDIGYQVPPGGSFRLQVDWEWLYGALSKGEYRIITRVLDFRGSGDFDEHYLSAEFTIID